MHRTLGSKCRTKREPCYARHMLGRAQRIGIGCGVNCKRDDYDLSKDETP